MSRNQTVDPVGPQGRCTQATVLILIKNSYKVITQNCKLEKNYSQQITKGLLKNNKS